MKTITLKAPWTYRSPMETIDFEAGKHEVRDEIAAAHAKEKADGSRTAETGAPGDPAPAES